MTGVQTCALPIFEAVFRTAPGIISEPAAGIVRTFEPTDDAGAFRTSRTVAQETVVELSPAPFELSVVPDEPADSRSIESAAAKPVSSKERIFSDIGRVGRAEQRDALLSGFVDGEPVMSVQEHASEFIPARTLSSSNTSTDPDPNVATSGTAAPVSGRIVYGDSVGEQPDASPIRIISDPKETAPDETAGRHDHLQNRSEERRVGKECRSRL